MKIFSNTRFSKFGFSVFSMALAFSGCAEPLSEESESQDAFYPIDFCIVSGNDFEEVGSTMVPFTYVHEGITIKFCCKPCLPKFKKDPKKYLVILEEEIEALKIESKSEG